MKFLRYSNPIPLVFAGYVSSRNSKGFPRAGTSNKGGVGKISSFLSLSLNISKTVAYTASYNWWLIGSHIWAFNWHQDRWPWMTLNSCKVKFSWNFATFLFRLWARRGFPPPRGNFLLCFFWNPNVSWAFFTCSAVWRLGRLWVIEVKGHQVHFWMWSISWSAMNDYLVNFSQCVSPKWSQMV